MQEDAFTFPLYQGGISYFTACLCKQARFFMGFVTDRSCDQERYIKSTQLGMLPPGNLLTHVSDE